MDQELYRIQRAMMSHALGELADSWRTLLHHQRAVGGRHDRHLQSMTRTPYYPDPIWNDGALGYIWRGLPQEEKEEEEEEQ